MSSLLPVAFYGLKVPAGDVPIPAVPDFPATFRVTMAAIDPSAPAQEDASVPAPRATLKIIREPIGAEDDDEDDDDLDMDQMKALLGNESDEDDEEEDDAGANGEGPSDPSKTQKARADALQKELDKEDEDDEMANGIPNGVNGVSLTKKGKAKVTDDEDDEEMDDDEDAEEMEEFVICTLDPDKNYQQPLDITVGENERVFFVVSGTHDIFLTGNYVLPPRDLDESDDYDEEDDAYDLSPDEDELDDAESEEDELDDIEDPRITELDEEEVPRLIKAAKQKGKNKRAAESDDEDEDEEETIEKLIQKEQPPSGEPKLSKKQAKKLKNNKGEAIAAAKSEAVKEEPQAKEGASKNEKKVQFAKNLEQGPSNSPKQENKNSEKSKAALSVKMVQGVKLDDKKLGVGPAAKKGDRVEMRYIGKLEKDGKVFDSNKKGKPFSFKLGVNEVIKGWDIGVAGMSVGGERRISVPANLGYGNKSVPGIPANSPLVFDVKLLAIK